LKTMQKLQVGRRQFIQISSGAAAGALLFGPELFAGETAPLPTRLAVGFASCIVDSARLPIDIEPAKAIWGSDGRFLNLDAHISVVSSGRAPIDPKARRIDELNAHFAYRDGGAERSVPFFAWTFDRSTGRSENRSNFRMPLDEQQTIRMTVGKTAAPSVSRRRAAGASSAPASLPFNLSLIDGPDSYRLARGFYIIVPLIDGEPEPDWSSCSMWYLDNRWGLHEGGDKRAATFEHLVLRVDYAG
jgi:hypothetical protein